MIHPQITAVSVGILFVTRAMSLSRLLLIDEKTKKDITNVQVSQRKHDFYSQLLLCFVSIVPS